MNYVILKQYQGRPYLDFLEEHYYTSAYRTCFYYVKPEDEVKIHEVKALNLFNPKHNHVLQSVPHGEYWTVNTLVQLLKSKEDSCFIIYADIDHERTMDMYSGSFLGNRDTHIYSIIRLDP